MPTITAVTPSARREGRFEIAVDHRPAATLSLDSIERLDVRVGREVDDALAAAMAAAARTLHVYDRALEMLAARARSAADLHRGLLRKGEPADAVREAIEHLIALGLLDDGAYARQFVRGKITGPGFSRRRLQAELARRGVARDVADAAIAEVMSDEALDQGEILERLAARKLRMLARLPAEVQRRRLYAFLARRGYDPDQIRVVMNRLSE